MSDNKNPNVVYAIMRAYYSDWELYGYFTDLDEAEKYIAYHTRDCSSCDELFIEELPKMDGKVDLSKVHPYYEYRYVTWFCGDRDGEFELNEDYEVYSSQYLRSSKFNLGSNWVGVSFSVTERNREIAEKIGHDLMAQFMSECNGHPTEASVKAFNKILSAEEDARKEAEKQEVIRQKELAEFERLKQKYGNISNEE